MSSVPVSTQSNGGINNTVITNTVSTINIYTTDLNSGVFHFEVLLPAMS